MLMLTLRDLQWRARRLVLGLIATSMVLGMTLILAGVSDSFIDEAGRTVDFFGGDAWVVSEGITGPFTATAPLPVAQADVLADTDGVSGVAPVVVFRHVATGAHGADLVNVIGYPVKGEVVRPALTAGTEPDAADEIVADDKLGYDVGDALSLGDERFRVVGLTHRLTFNGGAAALLMPLVVAQRLAYDSQPLASALVVTGRPASLPPGLTAMDPDAVRRDLLKPVNPAAATLGLLSILLWVVAAGIVGFVSYLSGLDRLKDFAVLKAIGVTSRTVAGSLLLQSLALALTAAGIAIGLALAIAPLIPLDVTIGAAMCLRLVGVAVVIGLVASVASIRRALGVDPVEAFGG